MFAIAFDLVVADTLQNHPKSVPQAYADIGGLLAGFGFERVQGSPGWSARTHKRPRNQGVRRMSGRIGLREER